MRSGRILSGGATALSPLLFGAFTLAACSTSDDTPFGKPDGGATDTGGRSGAGDSSAGGASSAGGSANGGKSGASGGAASGTGGGVTCGGATCTTTTAGTGVQASACCTTDDACGVRIPLSQSCLAHNQFGTTNPGCAPFEIPGQISAPGCCREGGCGARILFENIGCVSNEDLGRPHVACNPTGEPAGDGG